MNRSHSVSPIKIRILDFIGWSKDHVSCDLCGQSPAKTIWDLGAGDNDDPRYIPLCDPCYRRSLIAIQGRIAHRTTAGRINRRLLDYPEIKARILSARP